MKYNFGIDLGTTNSAIAVNTSTGTAHVSKIIPLRNGSMTLPSCVMYRDGKVIVGKQAFEERWDSEHVVYSVKRKMGTEEIIPILDDVSGKHFNVTPVQVSAEIIKELVKNASVMYGDIKDAVITVPAYFGIEQRRSTKQAAELAGLNVLSLISEPTAASLAYGLDTTDVSDQILVYDLGGGTFDVSLLKYSKLTDKTYELLGLSIGDDSSDLVCKVISTSGNNRLGGDDIDKALAGIIIERLKQTCLEEFGEIPKDYITPELMEKVILNVEICKRLNSEGMYQRLFKFLIEGEEHELLISWDASDFMKAFLPVFEKTWACVQQCLMATPDSHFSKIVLVGGSTKLPALKRLLAESFKNVEILDSLNPDESVAIGAAVKSSADAGDSGTTVDDILPMALGIETVNSYGSAEIMGAFTQIIPKNSVLPIEFCKSFRTNADNQKSIELKVYQGTSPQVINNTLLGTMNFDKVPEGLAGEVEVLVRFMIDVNGLLTVRVKTSEGEQEVKLFNILNPTTELTADTEILKKVRRSLAMLASLKLPLDKKSQIEEILYDAIKQNLISEGTQKIMDFISSENRKIFATARQELMTQFNTNMGGLESTGGDDEDDEEDDYE